MNIFFLKNIKIFLLLIIIFTNYKAYSLENKILLKIENEIITSLDVYNQVKYLSLLNSDLQKLENEKKIEIAKNNLIREKVKKKEILKVFKKIEFQESRIDDLIKSLFSDQKINNSKELSEYLHDINLDYSEIKEKILIQVYWNQLIFDKFSSKIKVDKNNLKKEILKNKSNIKKKYLLSEILFNIENKEDLKNQIKIIEQNIKDNGFKNTASNFSISNTSSTGGNLGWIDENVFIKEIKDEIDKIKVGEHTKPILTQSGFLILKIENIEEIEIQIDVEKELSKLINIKANQQLDQFSNIYYNKIEKNTLINEL